MHSHMRIPPIFHKSKPIKLTAHQIIPDPPLLLKSVQRICRSCLVYLLRRIDIDRFLLSKVQKCLISNIIKPIVNPPTQEHTVVFDVGGEHVVIGWV